MSEKRLGLLIAALAAAGCASAPRESEHFIARAREVRLVAAIDEVAGCLDLGPVSGRDVPGIGGWETTIPATTVLRRSAALAGADTVHILFSDFFAGGRRAAADNSRSSVAGRAYRCGARRS